MGRTPGGARWEPRAAAGAPAPHTQPAPPRPALPKGLRAFFSSLSFLFLFFLFLLSFFFSLFSFFFFFFLTEELWM